MIQAEGLATAYRTKVQNAAHELTADAPVLKGGGGAGFSAHELLEASLAVCINMAIRMYADNHEIQVDSISTKVTLTRPDSQTTRFEYSVQMTGNMSADQRAQLEAIPENCPVRQTLSKQLTFVRTTLSAG